MVGFRIGFDRTHQLRPSRRNTKTANVNKSVRKHIAEERQHDWLLRFAAILPWLD